VFTPSFVAQHPKRGEFSGGRVREQTTRMRETVRSILREAGPSIANVLKVNSHLASIGDFAPFNELCKRFRDEDVAARTTVHIARLTGEYALGIEMADGILNAQARKGLGRARRRT
jgi:enamine deaminase RidA (YjgF/YER057c/UK114 family)